jgi:hypothetical protein
MATIFPDWVGSNVDNQILFAEAEAYGASQAVLSTQKTTQIFLNTKRSLAQHIH